jgi:hypothetical protein
MYAYHHGPVAEVVGVMLQPPQLQEISQAADRSKLATAASQ